MDTEPNSTQSHAVLHTRRKGDAGCALPLLPPHGHGRRQQPPHATASMHCKRSIQIHRNVHLVCVVVCACRNTKQTSRKEGVEYVEGRKKCTAEVRNGSNKKKTAQTHDCTAVQAAAIHTRFIENKKNVPLRLTQTPSHKLIINKKKSSITVPNKFKKAAGCRVATPNCLYIFCPKRN
ncbi:hypothetical protein TCDM_12860 [Trypanosoma cruzi Dm28c]|uniref:Uncharacterized protein n=1 Tax=Trypanosoma cruzi Dm28c TaxID=1416333 RepID=V5A4H5_TRYCR|nr:hypothetical protein TCDM_12860 [Trypanosoma cruzi Dm28c]